MKEKDYEFLLEHWQHLVENLQDVNKSLRDLVESQQQTIIRLQNTQTINPITTPGKLPNIGPPNVWYTTSQAPKGTADGGDV